MSYTAEELSLCQKLVQQLAYQQLERGLSIPDEVSNFLLGDLIAHVGPTETIYDEDSFDEFVDKMEELIMSTKEEKKKLPVHPRQISDVLLNRIKLIDHSKRKELDTSIELFKKQRDRQKTFQLRLEEEANWRDVEISLLDAKQKLLEAKILKSLIYVNSNSFKAFKKVSEFVREEKAKQERQDIYLKGQLKKYKELECDEQFLEVFSKWTKLQDQRLVRMQLLDDRSNGCSLSLTSRH